MEKYNFLSHIFPFSHSHVSYSSDFSTPHGKIAIYLRAWDMCMAVAVNIIRIYVWQEHNVKYHQYRMLSWGEKMWEASAGGMGGKFHLLCCHFFHFCIFVHTCESECFPFCFHTALASTLEMLFFCASLNA